MVKDAKGLEDANSDSKVAGWTFEEVNQDQYECSYIGVPIDSVKLNFKSGITYLCFNKDSTSYSIDLDEIDDFSNEKYTEIVKQKVNPPPAQANKKGSYAKSACIHQLVSQNRLRFTSEQFNLDLAYISKRVIAMGYPAEGLRSMYRNPIQQVQEFFDKHHSNKVKVYNMCDDPFIDMNQLKFGDGKSGIRAAYFPMSDHNPGPVKLLFHFVLDLCLFLCQSEDSIAAVHCKAGKGRTGVAICAYLLFMEAVFDTYEAIEFFNKRRTKDGKGMGVASQMRYLHYFEKFLKSTFKPPYKQLLCPYIKNPTGFDKLLESKCRLKLMSICLGPFKSNPSYYHIKLQLSSFDKANLFRHQKAYPGKFGREGYTQHILCNKLLKEYYILLIFSDEIIITDDIKFKISNQKINSTVKLSFYYWLNARYVVESVGKVSFTPIPNRDNLNFSQFIMHDQVKRPYQYRLYDDYEVLQPSYEQKQTTSKLLHEGDCIAMSESSRSKSAVPPVRRIQSKHILEGLTRHFKESINKYDPLIERQAARIYVEEQEEDEDFTGKRGRSMSRRMQIKRDHQSLKKAYQEENYSDHSSDCNVDDESEEGTIGNRTAPAFGGGTFRLGKPKQSGGALPKQINSLIVNSKKTSLPTFSKLTLQQEAFQTTLSIQEVSLNQESSVGEHNLESLQDDDEESIKLKGGFRGNQLKTPQNLKGSIRKPTTSHDIDSNSVVNLPDHQPQSFSNIFGYQPRKSSAFNTATRKDSKIQILYFENLMFLFRGGPPKIFKAINNPSINFLFLCIIYLDSAYKQRSSSGFMSNHSHLPRDNESFATAGFNPSHRHDDSDSEDFSKQSHLPQRQRMPIKDKIAHFYSEKIHAEQMRKMERPFKDQLVTLTLSIEELDKFKPKKAHPDLRVQTTFYEGEGSDHRYFNEHSIQ